SPTRADAPPQGTRSRLTPAERRSRRRRRYAAHPGRGVTESKRSGIGLADDPGETGSPAATSPQMGIFAVVAHRVSPTNTRLGAVDFNGTYSLTDNVYAEARRALLTRSTLVPVEATA